MMTHIPDFESCSDSAAKLFWTNGSNERVILVDQQDQEIGVEEKIQAHLTGKLHRAFSIFVVNSYGQLLMQKRAVTKYHSRGLWSNTCCGHPRPKETISDASGRRLVEEMGIRSELKEVFSFSYRAALEDGFFENEYDHVLVGQFEGIPAPDPTEISDWRWMDLEKLGADLRKHPQGYSSWFQIAFGQFRERLLLQPTLVQ
jgi:isopentenyl-diphosphate delta-isomerase